MKDKLTLQQKEDILTGKGKTSGKYCNAIDENPYDSSEWTNYMPSSGWCFHKEDDGRISVWYEKVFACYDGWDSHVDDDSTEYFDNMEQAVNCIWTRESVDKVFDFIQGIKHAENITINEDSELSDKYNPTMLIDVRRDSGNGTCGSYLIDTFNMNDLLNNLIENVYPILRGKNRRDYNA